MILGSATSHRYLDQPGITVGYVPVAGGVTWVDICSDGTNWVIVGHKTFSTIYYGISSDLVTWTIGTVAFGNPRAIAANGNGFVIITAGNPTTQAYHSSNGTSWSSVTMPSGTWVDIKADATNFIGLSIRPFGQGSVSRSANGTSWSSVTNLPATSTGDYYNLTTTGSSYAITQSSPTVGYPTSLDATYGTSLTGHWNSTTIPFGWGKGATANNSAVVSVCANGIGPSYAVSPLYQSAYSTDSGATWNLSTLQDNYLDVGSTAYYFLAVGQVTNTATGNYSVSTDGINWTTTTSTIRTSRVSSKGLSYTTTNGNIFGGIEITGAGVTKMVIT